jgi:surface antigen
MKRFRLALIAVVLTSAVALGGCATRGPNETIGTLSGAVVGGVIGSQFGGGAGKLIATGVGTTLGAVIGGSLGRSLDERDETLMAGAQNDALEYAPPGAVREWRNADNGRYGSVTPGARYQVNDYVCRDYSHSVFIDGRRELLRGTACRQPDGTWRPLD